MMKDRQNFFKKLGHSLNLESKRYGNARFARKDYKESEDAVPITNTADLMTEDQAAENPEQAQQGASLPENMPVQPLNDPVNDAPFMPNESSNNIDPTQDIEDSVSVPPTSLDETPSLNDAGDDPYSTDATLASTTVAKKHAPDPQKDFYLAESAKKSDGLLRPVDVYETKNEIIVKATVAGVDRGNIKVMVTPESVTISGDRQKQERVAKESYFYQEFFWV